MIKKLGQQLMTMQTNNKSIPKSEDEAKHRNYQFWSTQPVPSFHTDTEVQFASYCFIGLPIMPLLAYL